MRVARHGQAFSRSVDESIVAFDAALRTEANGNAIRGRPRTSFARIQRASELGRRFHARLGRWIQAGIRPRAATFQPGGARIRFGTNAPHLERRVLLVETRNARTPGEQQGQAEVPGAACSDPLLQWNLCAAPPRAAPAFGDITRKVSRFCPRCRLLPSSHCSIDRTWAPCARRRTRMSRALEGAAGQPLNAPSSFARKSARVPGAPRLNTCSRSMACLADAGPGASAIPAAARTDPLERRSRRAERAARVHRPGRRQHVVLQVQLQNADRTRAASGPAERLMKTTPSEQGSAP
jgi:hypothetical protein